MKKATRWALMGLLLAGLAAVAACSDDKKNRERSDAGPDGGDTGGVSTDTNSSTTDNSSDTGTGTGEIEKVDSGPEPEIAGEDALADAPGGVLIIDDYESYADKNALLDAYSIATEGNDIDFTLDAEMKHGGNWGMRIDFTLGAAPVDAGTTDDAGVAVDAGDTGADYAGASLTIDQDWRGARAVQFWVKADRPDRVVVVQFQEDDGDFWELEYPVQGTDPYIAEIPIDQFVVPPWFSGGDDAIDLTYIVQFSIYMRGPTGPGLVYVDDFQVVAGNEVDTGSEPAADTEDTEDTGTMTSIEDAGDSGTTTTVDGGI